MHMNMKLSTFIATPVATIIIMTSTFKATPIETINDADEYQALNFIATPMETIKS